MSAVLEQMTLSRWGKSIYEDRHLVDLEKESLGQHVAVLADYSDAQIIVIHSKQRFGMDEFQKSPSLKVLITTTSGTDHIDVAFLKEKGVQVLRMPLIRRDAVVESILAMLLYANRRMMQFQVDAQRNYWSRGDLSVYLPTRIQDLTIAVVGAGVIGSRLIEVLKTFGADVVAFDPLGIPEGIAECSFEEMARCDVVLLACNLNPSTQFMVDSQWLSTVKEGLILINCARGKLVDATAALDAVHDGKLGFLGLDVFPEEPYPYLHRMNDHANVFFTPHAAGYHPHLAKQIREGLVDIVEKILRSDALPFVV